MARKPRNLSPEEKALWSSVAATANPMAKPVQPVIRGEAPSRNPEQPTPKPAFKAPAFEIGSKAGTATSTRAYDPAPDAMARAASAPLAMDQKTFRKLSKGKLTPEARIDLHGMTLADAEPALRGFIQSSQARGHRLVLVITGKGRTRDTDVGPIPERRGVLRDFVPRWLAQGPLGKVVLQVAPAHGSHGGGGAYYVYLRRLRR